MREIQLTTLLLFISLNSILSQNTIELMAFDCNRERESNTDISEIKFKILTEHKVISQSTKSKYDLFRFETSKYNIKIEYHNIYNQKVDTTINISPKTKKIFLCVEKMKDYEIKTFIENSILNNKKWKLEFSGSGCSGYNKTKIKFITRKKKTLFKYLSIDKWWKTGKKIKKKKVIELRKKDFGKLIVFEKKLRLLNDAKKRCGPVTYYYLTQGNTKLEFKDGSCVGIYKDYLKEIIERNN